MTVERRRKNLLADRLRLADRLVFKTVGLPCRRIALDQKSAYVRRVAVVMRVERSETGFHKSLRQRGEALAGAIPGEFVGRMRNRGAERFLKAAAHQRVQAVGGDDQIVTAEFIDRLDNGIVSQPDACGAH